MKRLVKLLIIFLLFNLTACIEYEETPGTYDYSVIDNNSPTPTRIKTENSNDVRRPLSMTQTYKEALEQKKKITKKSPSKVIKVVSKENLVKAKIPEKKISEVKTTAKKYYKKPVIVIDAGHGGKDPGATGRLGTQEKKITLAYSLALKKSLERTGRYKVVLTRSDDRFVDLHERVNIARKVGGDVMISIHADSINNKSTKGFSVYTLSEKRKNSEASKLLARANKEEVIKGANLRGRSRDIQEAIIDFAQGSTKDVSDDFAKTVSKHLGKKIKPLRKHQREGSLAVLTGADIPALLIELGYLSNEQEERMLKTEAHKQKIVTSITNAVNEYFSKFKMVF